MNNSSCGVRIAGSSCRPWLSAGLLAAGTVMAILADSLPARAQAQGQAQMTTQRLIGDAVSEIGARYKDVDEAIKRFYNRDFLGAREFLESAKRKDPSLPPTDLTLAKMYFLAGNASAGRASLEKAAMENPQDPEAYLLLADQAIQQGRAIEADALYDKGLELTQQFNANAKRKRHFEITARNGRSLIFERRKNWPAMVDELQALLKVDPENAVGHYRLGRALFMQRKFREGFGEFEAARKLDSSLPEPWVAAALTYDQLDMNREAEESFRRALSGSKSDANTLTAYGQWLIKTGSIDKAEQVLAEARQSNPESLNLLILSGVAARMNKKMKPAEDYFMNALGIAPANGDVVNQLALLLIDQPEQAKQERALQFAEISARLNNQSADAQVTYAWVLYQLGRMGEAEAALRNGLQLSNLGPDSSYLVAKILVDQKRPEAAKQILQGALDAESQGIFINRNEAQALLETLNRS